MKLLLSNQTSALELARSHRFLRAELFFTSGRISFGHILMQAQHKKRLIEGAKILYPQYKITTSFEEKIEELFGKIKQQQANYFKMNCYLDDKDKDINCFAIVDHVDERSDLNIKSLEWNKSFYHSDLKLNQYTQEFATLEQIKPYDDFIKICEGKVIEASTSNICLKIDNQFIFSSQSIYKFNGMTEKKFQQFLSAQQLNWTQRDILASELADVEMAFLMNAVRGVMSVSKINGRVLENNSTLLEQWKSYWLGLI